MDNLRGKKLLILCGNVVHVKVVEAAKEMGVYTIVTDSLPLSDAPAKALADEALFFNVLDVDNIVNWCKQNKVDGVLNFCNDIGHVDAVACRNRAAVGFLHDRGFLSGQSS